MEQEFLILCTSMHTLKTVLESRTLWWCSYRISWAYTLYNVYNHAKEGLRYGGPLQQYIGLVGVSAKWSYVTASPSHHDQAIPILSLLLFMHVGHRYIPLFKIRRIFDFLGIRYTVTAGHLPHFLPRGCFYHHYLLLSFHHGWRVCHSHLLCHSAYSGVTVVYSSLPVGGAWSNSYPSWSHH